ncbi:Nop14-like protein [Ceraceosorus guamensis]|uniref:Nop14-like protein n=1 Tax=Ceraceosorus guamensis TaxID=1522189 RepID=A0A316W4C9_9BASI|nr:Nop14-like protein [Ceraceosorus guamensis]PWN44710.1 Nop14-like protein [Ceraceosorus guamensis]
MAKGSQLKQLKARLSSDGIKDKRQNSAASRKRKSSSTSAGAVQKAAEEARRGALARIRSDATFNPFEERITKPKHEVLGRHLKGVTGRPGVSKSTALDQRRQKLLPEIQGRHRSGTFIDRRFGEGDANLTPEERALERFTRERQNRARAGDVGGKKSLFNLDDGPEDRLTHYGQSLNVDDMEDDGLGLGGFDDEDEHGGIDRATTSKLNFGGFDDENNDDDPDRKKSKYEVMQEVMAKSKLAKLERQRAKEKDDDLRMELDDDFASLREALFGPAQDYTEALREAERTATEPEAEGRQAKAKVSDADGNAQKPARVEREKSEEYDAFVRELAFDRRAQPQDRLKTADELAAEEAERLRIAEDARLRRMRGEMVPDGGITNRRAPGADDLDDDLDLDLGNAADVYGLGPGLGDARDEEEEDDRQRSDLDESDDDNGSDQSGDEGSPEEEDMDNFEDMEELASSEEAQGSEAQVDLIGNNPTSSVPSKANKGSSLQGAEGPSSSLPYTFSCPATHEDFLDLLLSNGISASDVPTVVQRIRALYHASLGIDNKHKLAALLGVLLEHCLHCSLDASAGGFKTVANLLPHIHELSQTYPTIAAQHFVGKLNIMHKNMGRGVAKGALDENARTWPGPAECALLRITAQVFPTSDRSHPVATPMALLIAQYLAHCRIRTLSDLASGLFLASLVASNERQSKRIFPESLNFLHQAIAVLTLGSPTGKALKRAESIKHAFGIPAPDLGAAHTAHLALTKEEVASLKSEGTSASRPADLLHLLAFKSSKSARHDAKERGEVKALLLHQAFALVEAFAQLYDGSVAYVELMQPYEELMACIDAAHINLPTSLQTRASTLRATLSIALARASQNRRALRLQAHRAIPLASQVPKFDLGGFDPTRKSSRVFDPDPERAEAAKLRALVKKEKKGAVRELRRDAAAVAEQRRRDNKEEEDRYEKWTRRVTGSLQDEEHQDKLFRKEKEKIKRERKRQNAK